MTDKTKTPTWDEIKDQYKQQAQTDWINEPYRRKQCEKYKQKAQEIFLEYFGYKCDDTIVILKAFKKRLVFLDRYVQSVHTLEHRLYNKDIDLNQIISNPDDHDLNCSIYTEVECNCSIKIHNKIDTIEQEVRDIEMRITYLSSGFGCCCELKPR